MAAENGFGGKITADEATTSESYPEAEKIPSTNGDQEDSKKSKGDEKTNVIPFRKLFSFADSTDILMMYLGTIGAIGNGICMPLMTILFGELTDSFGDNQNNHEVVEVVSKVSLKFVYLALGSGVAAFLQVACWMVTGERQAARIRGLYLKTILRQDVAFFDKETNTGEVVGRMSGDTVLIQDAMGEKVGKFIQLISTFIGGFVIAFIKGWLLTLVMLSSIPLLVASGAVVSTIIAKMASKGQSAYAKAANVVEQAIGSIRTVASFTGEKQAIINYNKFLVKAYESGVHEGLASGFGLGMVMLVVFCSYALAIWFGGKMILEKGYSGGDVLNVIIAVLTGSMSLGQASPCMSAFAAGQAAAFKMFETIERKPEIDAYDTKGRILDDIRGDIELSDVFFSYPSRPDEQIFNGFSLCIPSGTTAALVGQSGSGKSTVISLIERFYDPLAGEVLIDGINLKEYQLKWIRGKIGLVSQEPVLFASSIKDNISYGKDGATIEEIREATELANAAKFIDKLPQGLDTMVGEHGTQLSGGQKQRIAIARAILKDPRILLLDEATSALDAESERIVQEALDRIMVNRTTVIVAHRLSTIRNADMIAVIHRGKMVEKGSHSKLINDPDGAYSQLIRLQELNKESEQFVDDQNNQEITAESARQSSQRMSILRSISRGSSGVGNSSRHSFSVSVGPPTGINLPDIALAEKENPQLPAEEYPNVSLRRIAYLNKPEIPVLIIGAIAAVMNGTILPIFGLLISSVIKTFYEPPNELKKDSKFWAIMFMILGLASLLVIPARSYFFAVAGCELIQRIRVICFEKVVHMEVSWFDEPEHSSGAIGARLSADAASVRALVGDALGQVVENAAAAVAGLVIAFVASWQLAFIILVLIPLIGVNGYVQVKFMKGFSADAKMKYEEASQVANDAVGSIRTVASFCAEEKVIGNREGNINLCDPVQNSKGEVSVSSVDMMSRRSRHSRSPSPYRRYGRSVSKSVSRSRSRSRSLSSDVENPGNNLYVTGLSPRITKRELEKHFASEGKVMEVHLVVDPWTRESRGFGFVTMASLEEAERCVKYLNHSVLEGRVITVEKARRRRGRTPTPGRYLGLRTVHVRHRSTSYSSRRSPSYSPRRSPSYSPYKRGRSRSPRYSYERSRSRSYSPYYYRRRSYSPYYDRRRSYSSYYRRRSYSRSQSPYSRSPVSWRDRSYSPDDRYSRRHRNRYRSVSRSVSPRPRRMSRRSYSSSVSPRPRRRSRRSYSRSPTPRVRSSRRSYSRSISPRPKSSRKTPSSKRGYSRSYYRSPSRSASPSSRSVSSDLE